MEHNEKTYIAIDLKSFYASVECQERKLDPLKTNLVVADRSRTNKTICLAVSPALKGYGIPGRARLFEVEQRVAAINAQRRSRAPGRVFHGKSCDTEQLRDDPALELDYIAATPRMALYMQYSTRIYSIYLKYLSPEDIHVYSIDEVFIDATSYLRITGLTPHDFARKLVLEVLHSTGITATAGIGPNLYLCKVAMDIWAKRVPVDRDGVRIAELDEKKYRENLWAHEPITDFWRVGRGYAKKLASYGMKTMGDVARCSIGGTHDTWNEDLLYKLFGINAELLIDHAWGWEPCEIRHIKAFKPESNSSSVGQVLQEPYSFENARIIVREMAEGLALDLVKKGLLTDQIALTVGYDRDNLDDGFDGEAETDWYGRKMPKRAQGSENIGSRTSAVSQILEAALRLYDRIVDRRLSVRRMYVVANHVTASSGQEQAFEQLDLFSDPEEDEANGAAEEAARVKEEKLQQAMLSIKKRYGKNAILHGTSYQEKATARERNQQIGGHRS